MYVILTNCFLLQAYSILSLTHTYHVCHICNTSVRQYNTKRDHTNAIYNACMLDSESE